MLIHELFLLSVALSFLFRHVFFVHVARSWKMLLLHRKFVETTFSLLDARCENVVDIEARCHILYFQKKSTGMWATSVVEYQGKNAVAFLEFEDPFLKESIVRIF